MAYTELKLNYLLETKERIREAIEAKGQAVADEDTFRSYAEKIAAIGGSSETVIFAEQTLGFEYSEGFGAYYAGFNTSPFSLVDGQEYIVVWDGIENKRTAFAFTNPRDGSSCVALGNPLVTGGAANEDKFAVVEDKTNGPAYFFSLETTPSHTVKIYQKEEEVSYEDVHFVTFMSEDGTQELYKRPVADGDDCADPVIRGLIAEPEKESTAQYAYTLAGWSSSPNGALDENILKAVTADKTVYANYAAVLRYYTVNFYDGDTLLESQTVAYGSTPTIENPSKDGYSFDSWEPAITAVTGNITYTAKWAEKITFAGGSWADIVRIAEAGEAQKYFALGDTKTFSFTDPDGNEKNTTIKIVGFDLDELADGTGKAAISIMLTTAPYMQAHSTTNGAYSWLSSSIRSSLNGSVYESFPEALRNGIKTVKKVSRKYVDGTSTTGILNSEEKVWVPSSGEINPTLNVSVNYGFYPETQEEGRVRYQKNDAAQIASNTRTEIGAQGDTYFAYRSGVPKQSNSCGMFFANGSTGYFRSGARSQSLYVTFGFCI